MKIGQRAKSIAAPSAWLARLKAAPNPIAKVRLIPIRLPHSVLVPPWLPRVRMRVSHSVATQIPIRAMKTALALAFA